MVWDKIIKENKELKEKLNNLSIFARNIELHMDSYFRIARELQILKWIWVPDDPIKTTPFKEIKEAKDWNK